MKTANPDIATRVCATVDAWRGARILVAGDVMLDEYIYGRSERVSREAPVIIVRYEGSAFAPGGAANAALNVAALGGKAVVCGVTGQDDAGRRLRAALERAGARTSALLEIPRRATTSKMRVLAGDYHAQLQQVVRIDREDRRGIPERVGERLRRRFASAVRSCDAVILSDYGRGVLDETTTPEFISIARAAGVPIVADSRFGLGRFRGVTTATPNELEAAAAAGTRAEGNDALERTGRALLRRLSCESLLITRGRLGMALFRRRRPTETVAVVGSPEATDVTGAGDTVVAVVALALAAGADMSGAMHAANIAASIVVMKRGTAVATPSEMRAAVEKIAASEK